MIKEIIMRMIFFHRGTSKSYLKYLRKKGCKIGNGTIFFYPRTGMVDITQPSLIEIGENVQITKNVTILTHGYDWSVIKGLYGDICGSAGKVKIGNNVFIGFNTTVLKGTTIGDNVIIGANSLVNHDIPSNVVVAGNPAKVIMSIDEYYQKRKKKQLEEAEELFISYYNRYNKIPDEKILREFIFLFKKRDKNLKNDKIFAEIGSLINNIDKTYDLFMSTDAMFEGYEAFIEHCKKKYKLSKKSEED